jgi:hypothetical protein
LASPACVAWMVHVPTATRVAVVPDTVHTGAVNEAKLTGKLEEAVALRAKGALPSVIFESAPNVMVWLWIGCTPVPCSLMVWLADSALSSLSVKTAVLVRAPAACGVKLMLRLQLAPGAIGAAENPVPQSAGAPDPSPERIKEAMSGNLCRCTGYQQIVESVEQAARRINEQRVKA